MDEPTPSDVPCADALISAAREGIWVTDAEGRTTFVSERMAEMLGCAPSEMLGKAMADFFDEGVPHEAIRQGRRQSECCLRRTDGSELRALVSTTPMRGERGRFHGTLGTITDVSEQRKVELEQSPILDAMTDIITYLDPELRVRYMNAAAAAYLRAIAEEPVGWHCYELRQGCSAPCPACPSLTTLETRQPAEAERRTPDGRVWLLRTFPVLGGQGEVVGVAEFARDITATTRAAEALRERDGVIRAVLEASQNPVLVVRAVRDDAGRICDFEGILGNPAAAALMGPAAGARLAVGHPAVEAQDLVACYARVVETGKPMAKEMRFQRPGRLRWFILSAVKLGDGAAITFTDITERKQAELEAARLGEQVRQAEFVEKAATLAAGVAHDVNNLLQSIYATTELAVELIPPSNPAREPLQHTFTAARAATALVRRLTALRTGASFRPCALRLNALIEQYADVLACIAGERVTLRFDLRAEHDSVHGVANELEQVLLNLCLNARDAMPAGGTLTLSTRDVTQGPSLGVDVGAPPRCFVRLSVSDTGSGMSQAVFGRMFEPFFTTKAPEHGTGLGLPTVRTIVERHSGSIDVESAEGRGTTVRILLPRPGA
jgi:two-component system, cell cycle sensor histidine kinase and response regulator CckA